MKTVLILSGGMDSVTLLYDLLAAGDAVDCISFDYGQRHAREITYAREIASGVKCKWDSLLVTELGRLLPGSSQTDPSVPVPAGRYDEPSMKKTVVPNRNMVMLSMAGAVAIARGADRLAYGAHAGDHTIYPDCRPCFVGAMQAALALCDWHPIDLYAPYLQMSKGDICRLGVRLGVPFEKTWTCYAGDWKPCGQCGACVERREAFEFAGVADPLLN